MLFARAKGVEWLAVFLGNPGLRYEHTRHNAGFMAADEMAKLTGTDINRSRFQALTGMCDIAGHSVMLMKPQTYMNLSGQAVGQAARFYKIPPERIIVVSDEIALPMGKLRIRQKGSAGGHNGLKSIIASLGTEQFPRVRMGVGAPPNPDFDMPSWVLSVFRGHDLDTMLDAAGRAAQAVECYIAEGAERAMGKFN